MLVCAFNGIKVDTVSNKEQSKPRSKRTVVPYIGALVVTSLNQGMQMISYNVCAFCFITGAPLNENKN